MSLDPVPLPRLTATPLNFSAPEFGAEVSVNVVTYL